MSEEIKRCVNADEMDAIMPMGAELWPAEEDLEPLLRFHDRRSYLDWVQKWKEEYRDLSGQIRRAKRWEKEASRAPETVGAAPGPSALRGKMRARGMLALRALGKRVSWQHKTSRVSRGAA